jgi:SAM-dependent methyltransferase
MHEQVLSWVAQFRTDEDLAVLDIGGRDLNGSTRPLFPNANPYHVLDLRPGPNVDFVADAADWRPDAAGSVGTVVFQPYDLVLCTETFEHAKGWREIIKTAWDVLRPGGWLIFTCAGPGRPPHSGVEPVWGLIGDEWYANVSPDEIRQELTAQGWIDIEARQLGLDTQGKAVKADLRCHDCGMGFSCAKHDPRPDPEEPREVLLGATLSRTADIA